MGQSRLVRSDQCRFFQCSPRYTILPSLMFSDVLGSPFYGNHSTAGGTKVLYANVVFRYPVSNHF